MSLATIIRHKREHKGLTQDVVAAQAGISKPYLSNIETGKAKNPPTDGVLKGLERVLDFERGQLTRLAHLERTPMDVREERENLEAVVKKLRAVLKQLHATTPRRRLGGIDLDSIAELVRDKSNVRQLSGGVAVPIINKVAAGYPHHFTDLDYPPSVADEYTRCPDIHDAQAFGARVVGDLMEPTYVEGNIVVFSPNTPVSSGDDCFVRFDGDRGTTFKRYYQDDDETIRLQPLNSKYPGKAYAREEITGLWPAVYRIQRVRDL